MSRKGSFPKMVNLISIVIKEILMDTYKNIPPNMIPKILGKLC